LNNSQQGVRQDAEAPPMSFSSSESAIAPEMARQYALAEPTVNQPNLARRDPAITAGGFDARAAAAATAASRAGGATVSATPATERRPVSGDPFSPAAGNVYDRRGTASIISTDLDGQPTANGERYDRNSLTAAHPTLPLPSLVHVINTETGRETVVRVNDRGPFSGDGLIELSERAAELLGAQGDETPVRVRFLGPAPAASALESAPAPVATPDSTPVERAPLFSAPETTELPDLAPRPVAFPGISAANTFFVQLGSFTDIGNAKRLHDQLSRRTSVKIVPVTVRGADYFRVLAGPLGDRSAADRLRDRLSNQGVADGFVVSGDS
ncbi:MAG: septal ring lytic transglycosylase RlpA family protein, partial [Pseudomonadota bacterium]